MPVEIKDKRFSSVVGPSAPLERLATGFKFVEGAAWDARLKRLVFSDIPGDIMRTWTQGKGIELFRRPSGMANGNAFDRQGLLVTCEHATSRVTRTGRDGRITAIATHYDGKQLNSPNDLVVRSDGSIYFTDPSFGRMEYYGVKREQELSFRGVFRLGASGGLTLLATDFEQPNGLCFSLDESKLYINDTMRGHIRVFDVKADGGISGGDVWAKLEGEGDGAPDGLKMDSAGNIYSAGPGGLHVFASDATPLGVIRTPEVAANFCWGEDDLMTLFIVASTSLYRTRTKVPGHGGRNV
ncbi:MAG: SMP-30/gluconolactonase/LRE family protein [SAR202 cluster bacterium]|nr:SMP-30/gluconolactonase/LRE family protein [SAR202 cluster bacterium]